MWDKWRALLLSLCIRLSVLKKIFVFLNYEDDVTSKKTVAVANLCLHTQLQNEPQQRQIWHCLICYTRILNSVYLVDMDDTYASIAGMAYSPVLVNIAPLVPGSAFTMKL